MGYGGYLTRAKYDGPRWYNSRCATLLPVWCVPFFVQSRAVTLLLRASIFFDCARVVKKSTPLSEHTEREAKKNLSGSEPSRIGSYPSPTSEGQDSILSMDRSWHCMVLRRLADAEVRHRHCEKNRTHNTP